MPLSEHEQRLLEQMEQALYAEDPKFASTLRGADIRRHYRRRAAAAGLAFVVGVVLLLLGVATKLVPVSVLGFVVMLASAVFAVTSWRHVPVPGDTASGKGGLGSRRSSDRQPTKRPRRGFMNRIEDRWNRRREPGQGR